MRRPRRTRPRPPKTPWSRAESFLRLRRGRPRAARRAAFRRHGALLGVPSRGRDRPGGRHLPGGDPQAAAPRARRARRNPRTEIVMNTKKRIDLEDRLSSFPAPPPPEDLAREDPRGDPAARGVSRQEAARGFHARLGARGRDGGADRCGDLARLPGQPVRRRRRRRPRPSFPRAARSPRRPPWRKSERAQPPVAIAARPSRDPAVRRVGGRDARRTRHRRDGGRVAGRHGQGDGLGGAADGGQRREGTSCAAAACRRQVQGRDGISPASSSRCRKFRSTRGRQRSSGPRSSIAATSEVIDHRLDAP